MFQHTATRRWLQIQEQNLLSLIDVSTHSHPKVAATINQVIKQEILCFNTQPPEGGCLTVAQFSATGLKFQHTATRRWLPSGHKNAIPNHSSFNTQPPEGGCISRWRSKLLLSSFNTQPPEGGCKISMVNGSVKTVSTHSHPKVAAC